MGIQLVRPRVRWWGRESVELKDLLTAIEMGIQMARSKGKMMGKLLETQTDGMSASLRLEK